ncbi:MAG TPA: hypothetical protein PKD56_06520, partial [Chitinophagales bacterium]|nr:hypothetical protein [Chitinophagales bacterium]
NAAGKYFMRLLALKLVASLLYAGIYVYIYAGDTVSYYQHSTLLYNEILTDNTGKAWQLLYTSNYQPQLATKQTTLAFKNGFKASNTYMVVKTATLLSFLCFNNYWVLSMIFGFFAFLGLWAMYRVFYLQFWQLDKHKTIMAIFLMPSVFFWGSGIMKDTLTLGALGWLLWGIFNAFILQKRFLISSMVMLLSYYTIDTLKGYVLLAFIPFALVWVVLHFFKYNGTRYLRATVFMLVFAVASLYVYQNANIITNAGNIVLEKIIDMAMGYQSWHEFLANTKGQSGYTLGTIVWTIQGVISKIPASIEVALFRPYFNEVRNSFMLLLSIESTLVLLCTIWVVFRVGLLYIIRIIFTNPFLLFCLGFSLSFAFAVGFTSYNFGALARYKIPLLPFYMFFLFAVYHYGKKPSKAQAFTANRPI